MLIDVSMLIIPGSMFRLGTPPVEIATQKLYHESEGEYESVMLSLPAHTATHLDLVFAERRVDPEQMIGPGVLIDATQLSGRDIQLENVTQQVTVERGDFVLFRTDWSQYVGTERYNGHPELSGDVVEWLISKQVNAVGIDALGLGRGRRHGEYDRLLAGEDILVIENLTNLGAIPEKRFKVYCFPLKIEHVDAIPARVMVEVCEGDSQAD